MWYACTQGLGYHRGVLLASHLRKGIAQLQKLEVPLLKQDLKVKVGGLGSRRGLRHGKDVEKWGSQSGHTKALHLTPKVHKSALNHRTNLSFREQRKLSQPANHTTGSQESARSVIGPIACRAKQ